MSLPIIDEIRNLIEPNGLVSFSDLKLKSEWLGEFNIPYSNTTFSSEVALKRISAVIITIKSALDSWILDDLPINKLTQIKDHLVWIKNSADTFFQNPIQDYFRNIVNNAEPLYQIFFELWLFETKNLSLAQEKQKVTKIIWENQGLFDRLNKSNTVLAAINAELIDIQERKKELNVIELDYSDKYKKLQEQEEKLVSISAWIQQSKDSIDTDETKINEKRWLIEKFYWEIEEYKKTYNSVNTGTTEIFEKFKNYQETVDNLIQRATSAGLFWEFQVWKDLYLKKEQFYFWTWVISIIIFILVASWIAKWIWDNMLPAIEKGNIGVIVFHGLKIFILTPLIYFVFFIKWQHSRAQYLLEWYNFKSVVALSLPNYQKLLNDAKDSEVAKITELAMERIFTPIEPLKESKNASPTDNTDKDLSTIWTIIDKFWDLYEKIKK